MKKSLVLIFVMLMFSITIYAQKDTVLVDGFWETQLEGTLNDAIQVAVDAGTVNNTVFKLKPYEQYVLSRSIFMDYGQNLELYADKPGATQDDAPPQILWTSQDVDKQLIIQTYGDLKVSNVWFRFANTQGDQQTGSIAFEDSLEANDIETGIFIGCIFDYNGIGAESGGTILVKADHFVGKFYDCYWRNNIDKHFRYYGRAISFPWQSTDYHYEELLFENCTFANIGRIVMQEGNEFGTKVQLNHCTVLNVLETVVEQGWFQYYSATNSVFLNPRMLGYRAIDQCDDDQDMDDFEDGLCNPPAGGLVQGIYAVDSFGFVVDFTDDERGLYVANNAYIFSDYLTDWYVNAPSQVARRQQRQEIENYFPNPMVGQSVKDFQDSVDTDDARVFPNINVDSTSIIFEGDPQFVVEPTNQDTMLQFVDHKWDLNQDVDWSYQPQAGYDQIWPLPEDLTIQNSAYLTASMGGFPLGDLNWSNQKAAWAAQKDAEYAAIEEMLSGTVDVKEVESALPSAYQLEQNYPNPFNPTTNIKYSIPEAGFVTLKVYNSLGELVNTIFAGQQSAGNYIATFDGSNLSSGVYFYTLQAGDFVTSKKLVLMK